MAITIKWDFELQITSSLSNASVTYKNVVTAVFWTCTASASDVDRQHIISGTRRLPPPKSAKSFVSADALAAMVDADQDAQIFKWLGNVDPMVRTSAESLAVENLRHLMDEPRVDRMVIVGNSLAVTDAPRPNARGGK